MLHAAHPALPARPRQDQEHRHRRRPRRCPASRRSTSSPRPATELFYAGDEILAIAADTEEHADDALRAIKVEYEVLPHPRQGRGRPARTDRRRHRSAARATGNVSAGRRVRPAATSTNAFKKADAVDRRRPTACRSSATSAWNRTAWSPSGTSDGEPDRVGLDAGDVSAPPRRWPADFKIPPTKVKCITHYMGGGFGSKFGPDIQGIAAAELARKAGAPVKLMLDRAEEVTVGGNRPSRLRHGQDRRHEGRHHHRLRGRLLRHARRRRRRHRQPRPAALRLPRRDPEHQAASTRSSASTPAGAGHAGPGPSAELRADRVRRRRPGRQARHRPAGDAPARTCRPTTPTRASNDPHRWPAMRNTIYTEQIDIAAQAVATGRRSGTRRARRQGRRSSTASAWPAHLGRPGRPAAQRRAPSPSAATAR